MVNRGDGSIVGESILKHPDRDEACVLAKMMAVYSKLPRFMEPAFRRLMKPFANTIFLVTIPVVFPWQELTRLQEPFRMVRSTRKILKKTK